MYFQISVVAIVVLLGAAMLRVLYVASQGQQGTISNRRRQAGDILIGIGGAVMLFSGCLKFAHVPLVVAEMTSLGLAGWKLELVASLELLSGFLFLVPRFRSVGFPIASAYLGAAIAAHIRSDQYFAIFPTLVIMGCCWLGAALRHPHLLWSLAAPAEVSTTVQSDGQLATRSVPGSASLRGSVVDVPRARSTA